MTDTKIGWDIVPGLRYKVSDGSPMTRCPSCNLYRGEGEFTSSSFRCVCNSCKKENKQLEDNRKGRPYENIYFYIKVGSRREFGDIVWQYLKTAMAPKKRDPNRIGRPSTKRVKQRMLLEVMNDDGKVVPEKYREPIRHLIANGEMPAAQLMWLALRKGVLPDKVLRLAALDTAKAIAASSSIEEICGTTYSYLCDDIEFIANNPTNPAANAKSQGDLRYRLANIAKEMLGHPDASRKDWEDYEVTWNAYEALSAVTHFIAKSAAESTAYYYVKTQMCEWNWYKERALKSLMQFYAKRMEAHVGVASDAVKEELLEEITNTSSSTSDNSDREEKEDTSDNVTGTNMPKLVGTFWVACNVDIYPPDRYLVCTDEDEEGVTLFVFHNPSKPREVGGKFKVLRDDLTPGENGYGELRKEDLIEEGVKLP